VTPARKASLLLVLACVGWGVGFPLMKAVMQAQQAASGTSGTWLTAQHQLVRYVVGGLLLAALAWWSTRRLPNRKEIAQGAICGATGGIGLLLQVDALNYSPASTVGFITQFYVLLIPLVTGVRLRRWPGWITLISVGLALAGVAVLSGISPSDLRPGVGELMVLTASVIFTVQIFAISAPRWVANDGLQVSTMMFVVMTILTLPVVLWSGPGLGGMAACYPSAGLIGLMVVIILFSTCLPYAIMNLWQRDISSTEAGIIYCSEALFAAGSSLFVPALIAPVLNITYLNEVPGVTMLIGGGLILAGAILVQVAPHWRQSTAKG